MNSKTKGILWAFMMITLMLSSYVLGTVYGNDEPSHRNILPLNPDTYTDVGTNTSENNDRIGVNGQIIYMKYFTRSGSYSVSYGKIRGELVGSTSDELKKHFDKWNVLYMDTDKVILQREIDSYGPQTYIISTTVTDEDEFVCVYTYDDNGSEVIYSVFDTPVSLFDEQTIQKLKDGIMVQGKDELLTALEAFGE